MPNQKTSSKNRDVLSWVRVYSDTFLSNWYYCLQVDSSTLPSDRVIRTEEHQDTDSERLINAHRAKKAAPSARNSKAPLTWTTCCRTTLRLSLVHKRFGPPPVKSDRRYDLLKLVPKVFCKESWCDKLCPSRSQVLIFRTESRGHL